MNHDSMPMTMNMGAPTATGMTGTSSAASMGSMGGMDHGGMGGGCKISVSKSTSSRTGPSGRRTMLSQGAKCILLDAMELEHS